MQILVTSALQMRKQMQQRKPTESQQQTPTVRRRALIRLPPQPAGGPSPAPHALSALPHTDPTTAEEAGGAAVMETLQRLSWQRRSRQEGRGGSRRAEESTSGLGSAGRSGKTASFVEKASLKCRGRKSTAFFDFRIKSGLKLPSRRPTGNFILLIKSPRLSSVLRRGER